MVLADQCFHSLNQEAHFEGLEFRHLFYERRLILPHLLHYVLTLHLLEEDLEVFFESLQFRLGLQSVQLLTLVEQNLVAVDEGAFRKLLLH